ncbi:hypothetical protein ABTA99_19580, partial [Acinetobacter baumannii]
MAFVAPNLCCASQAQQTESQTWTTIAASAREKLRAGDLLAAQKDYQDALTVAERQQQIDPGVVTCLSGLSL